jgi:metal-responsive CopG/Arc/MetJ family transcriptional regulator
MSTPDVLPDPAEPKPDLVPVSLMLDQDLLDWLDGLADGADRSRSYVLRSVLRPLMAEAAEKPKLVP